MKLSVIVPVYNEEQTVLETLDRLLGVKQVKEVIIVDDGSTDTSASKIDNYLTCKRSRKASLYKKENGGKGSAVRFGLTKVTGDYVMIQDADLEYDPLDIPLLIKPIESGRVQVVYGSRFLGPHSNLLFWHRVGNAFLNLVVNVLYNTTLSDMETCYKVLPTALLKEINLQANQFDIEPEITCKILKKGVRIFEVPISYVGRDFSEGKKITWVDGIAALQVIISTRFF